MKLIDVDGFLETHGQHFTASMYVGPSSEIKAFNKGIDYIVYCLKECPEYKPTRKVDHECINDND